MVSSVHHIFPGSSTTVSGRFLFSLRSRLSFLRGSTTTLAPTAVASLATACFTPSCRSVTLECSSSLQDIACHASAAYDPLGCPKLQWTGICGCGGRPSAILVLISTSSSDSSWSLLVGTVVMTYDTPRCRCACSRALAILPSASAAARNAASRRFHTKVRKRCCSDLACLTPSLVL